MIGIKTLFIIIASMTFVAYSIFSQTYWSLMSLPGFSWKTSVFFVDSSIGYITGEYGEIYKTTNVGLNWNQQISGVNSRLRSIYFINAETGFVVGNNTFLWTSDGGINWDSIYIGFNGLYEKILFVNNNTGFLIANPARVLKSTNSGVNWHVSFQQGEVFLADIFFINENTGFLNGYSFMMKTTNQGNNWYSYPNPPVVDHIYFINSTTGFTVSHVLVGPYPPHPELVIYKTTDSGSNWYDYSPFPRIKGSASSIAFLNENVGYVGYSPHSIGGFTGLLKTVNGGSSWFQQLPSGASISSIYFVNNNIGFVVGSESYKSTNAGSNLTSIDLQNTIPQSFLISQNYPNPFNPITMINYDIPQNSIVKLTIYDILGREVNKLVNNEFKQPGRYVVEFNGTNLASGVYFYRLEAGDFIDSKKMVLVK